MSNTRYITLPDEENTCSLYVERQGKQIETNTNPNQCYILLLQRVGILKLKNRFDIQPTIDAKTCSEHYEKIYENEKTYSPAVEILKKEIA